MTLLDLSGVNLGMPIELQGRIDRPDTWTPLLVHVADPPPTLPTPPSPRPWPFTERCGAVLPPGEPA